MQQRVQEDLDLKARLERAMLHDDMEERATYARLHAAAIKLGIKGADLQHQFCRRILTAGFELRCIIDELDLDPEDISSIDEVAAVARPRGRDALAEKVETLLPLPSEFGLPADFKAPGLFRPDADPT
jgi:hypothetical protein